MPIRKLVGMIAATGLLLTAVSCNLGAAPIATLSATDTPKPPTEEPTLSLPTLTPSTEPPTNTPAPTDTPTNTPTPILEPIRHLTAGDELDLVRVDMVDRLNGWAMGGKKGSHDESHVFRTINGGKAWLDVSPPEITPIEGAGPAAYGAFANSSIGWITYSPAAGSGIPAAPVVWLTADAGATWKASAALDTAGVSGAYRVTNISFSGKYGWVLAHGAGAAGEDPIYLYRSADNGLTWSRAVDPVSAPDLQKCQKTGLLQFDGNRGWLTGGCKGLSITPFLYRTDDGGVSWTAVKIDPPASQPALLQDTTRWCETLWPSRLYDSIGMQLLCHSTRATPEPDVSYFYFSNNRGQAWNIREYPGGQVFVLEDHTGLAFGRDIYRTDDGAVTWKKIATVDWLGAADFINAREGWAVGWLNGAPHLYGTLDGGVSWTELFPAVTAK